MPQSTLTLQTLAALAHEDGLEIDSQRLALVASTLAFIRSSIGRLEELELTDDKFAQPFDIDWN
ncbi:hypothetical protein [Herbaspirillum rubrisubalbicans]|uniref:hypothetical protein n=1 Tax=Herbaspirillum rubrisubalbicans TaxID=80842 RepID=UPI00209F89B0|nr:hypothetical protein [Herbaspirillum rubrisubalbicans]MCP1576596.1 hypothetical protein [Herbaspirillum rubrisubalbicans]